MRSTPSLFDQWDLETEVLDSPGCLLNVIIVHLSLDIDGAQFFLLVSWIPARAEARI